MALSSENVDRCAGLRTLLLTRFYPAVTVGRRTLVHVGCTLLAAPEGQRWHLFHAVRSIPS